MKDDGGLDQDSKQEKVKRGQVFDVSNLVWAWIADELYLRD